MQIKKRFLLFYYVALILVMILYTRMDAAPMTFRLAYLAALLLPLTMNLQYFPAVLITTLAISQNSFAYPLVPDDNYYYVIITLLFAVLSIASHNRNTLKAKKDQLSPLFIIILSYLVIINLFQDGQILMLSSSVFICVMLYLCARRYLAVNSWLIAIAFMVFSLAMSYWLIFHPEARVLSAHGEEGMTWADANYLGGMAGMGCIIAVMGLLYAKKTILHLVICALTIVSTLYFLAIMTSRGAILAVGLSSIALVLFSRVKRTTKALYLIGVIGIILFVYYSKTFELLMSRFNAMDTTGTGRTLIWTAKLKGFFQEGTAFNLIFGFGSEGGYSLGASELGRIRAFHNDFISVLVEYGLIGLVLFILALIYPYHIANKEDKPIIAALLLYLVTIGLTLEPVISGRFVFVAFLFFTIILAKSGIRKEITTI